MKKRILFLAILAAALFGGAAIKRVLLGSLLVLKKDGDSDYVALQSAPGLSASTTWTLPSADGTSGQVLKTDGSGTLDWVSAGTDPMTTRGDMLYRDSSNTTERLAVGSAGDFLVTDGTDVSWGVITSARIPDGTIVDADVDASAAIAGSKIQAAGTGNAGAVTTGTQSLAGAKTFTGDVTVSGALIASSGIGFGEETLTTYSEDTLSLDNEFTAGSVHVVKVGKQVTITTTSTPTHSSDSVVSTSAGFIPEGFRPAASAVYQTYNYSSSLAAVVSVSSAGTLITRYHDPSAGTTVNRVDTGVAFSISYTVP